jgi:hypothetical protein
MITLAPKGRLTSVNMASREPTWNTWRMDQALEQITQDLLAAESHQLAHWKPNSMTEVDNGRPMFPKLEDD